MSSAGALRPQLLLYRFLRRLSLRSSKSPSVPGPTWLTPALNSGIVRLLRLETEISIFLSSFLSMWLEFFEMQDRARTPPPQSWQRVSKTILRNHTAFMSRA